MIGANPDGLYVIHPARALNFIKQVPIEDFWGVGPVTAARMRNLRVNNGATLGALSLSTLLKHFGKTGYSFYNFARGIDHRPVRTEHIRRSVSCEETLSNDTSDIELIMQLIAALAEDLEQRIERSGFRGRTFVLKVKYSDFKTHTRSHTYLAPLLNRREFIAAAKSMLSDAIPHRQTIRLVGIGVADNASRAMSPHEQRPTIDFVEYE